MSWIKSYIAGVVFGTTRLLMPAVFLIMFFISGCSAKSVRKSMEILERGDTMETAVHYWGEPDRKIQSSGPWGEREVWVYDCQQFGDCDNSNCFFLAPCYYLCFENGELMSKYSAVIW